MVSKACLLSADCVVLQRICIYLNYTKGHHDSVQNAHVLRARLPASDGLRFQTESTLVAHLNL
jgi:hypothetical protein